MNTSIRQILVHLDATDAALQRLAIGRRIGQEHGAEIAALFAANPSFVELPYAPELGPSVAASLVEIDEERQNGARAAFDRAMGEPGPAASWSQTSEVPIIGAFVQQAFYADLMVLGQRNPADRLAATLPADFVESVLMASGKPGLVVPYVGCADAPFGNVVIAWKETRESARAVAGAMPLLERASQVQVLTWGAAEPAIDGSRLDLDRYLRSHGIEAEWHRSEDEPDELGELLLSRAADLSADLMVMGCYGRSRAREWVLGGVTRTVLHSMTVPVLMAH